MIDQQKEYEITNAYLAIVNTKATHDICRQWIEKHIAHREQAGHSISHGGLVFSINQLIDKNASVFVIKADVKLSHLKTPEKTKLAQLIVDHLEDYWRAHLYKGSKQAQSKHDDYVNQLTPGIAAIIDAFNETKEKDMNDNQPYVMKEYVNGRNIDDMTADEMIEAISILEAQLKHLNGIKTKAKGIEAKKDQIDTAITRVASAIGSRRISRREFYTLGGFGNPRLWRRQRGKDSWHYYIRED